MSIGILGFFLIWGIFMFNSVEFVRGLCRDRKIAISVLEKECGFANGYLNPKKMAKLPYDRAVIISNYLGVSVDMILTGEESDDNRALTSATNALTEMLSNTPDAPSKDRLQLLFDASDFDIDVVCFNLGIDQSVLDNWLSQGNLPPRPVVDKIMGVFHIQPHQLLSKSELDAYHSELSEWGIETKNAPAENGKGDVLEEVDVAFYGEFKELSDDDKEIVRSMVTAMRQRRGKI